MKFPIALIAAASLLAGPVVTSAAEPATTPKPPKKSLTNRVFNRIIHPFGGDDAAKEKGAQTSKSTVALKLEPQPLKLSAANRLKVTLTISNLTKKLMQLEFPTSQRIDVLLKTNIGKTVEQWSQDQAFTQEVTVVTINPGERAEYVVEVATRDLVAGQTYLVEGLVPHHEKLRAETSFVPEK